MVFDKRRVWIFSLQWFSILLLSLSSRIFCEQQVNDIAAFQKLFMAKRIEQLAAVKNIQKLDDSKRKLLLDQISVKLFQVGCYIMCDLNYEIVLGLQPIQSILHEFCTAPLHWCRCIVFLFLFV